MAMYVKVHAMKPTHVHLTDAQGVALKRESDKTGVPVAALIRKALDAYLAKQKGGR